MECDARHTIESEVPVVGYSPATQGTGAVGLNVEATAAGRGDLDRMIRPSSVAVVGVSGRPDSLNARPVRYLREHGFSGDIFPVNPRYDELQGLTCYPDLASIGRPVDLVLVLVPAVAAADVVQQAGRIGAAGAIVFGSGFAEVGEEGGALQEQLARAGREAGVRVLGPNCQGMIHTPTGLFATFTAAADRPLEGLPGVAYVGQSGAVGGSILDLAAEMGLALTAWVSTGNQADLDLVEVSRTLLADPEIRVLLVYAESIGDGAAYDALARQAKEAGRRLVVLRSGRSAAGRRAAASHTGSMLGDDVGFELTSRRHGVILVDDVPELLAVGATLAGTPAATGRRVGIVTTSGGAGSLAADHCGRQDLEVPELGADTQAVLSGLVPDFGSCANPVDVTAQLFNREGSARALGEVCAVVAADPEVDQVAVVLTMVIGEQARQVAADLVATSADLGVPLLVSWLAGAEQTAEARGVLRERGLPVFSSIGDLVRVAGHLVPTARPGARPESGAPVEPELLEALAAGRAEPAELLDRLGVTRPRTRLLTAGDGSGDVGAATAVEQVGGVAALKVRAGGLLHKSDVGGVVLGVGADEATQVQADLLEVARLRSLDGLVGVEVQEMVPPGIELIVGLTQDVDGYAPVVTVGIGGVTTELYRDVTSALAPVDAAEAEAMLRSLRGWPLLDGFRGSTPADVAAAAEAVAALSHAFDGFPGRAAELEVNPLVVGEKGRGVHAVDLLVTSRGAP